MIGVWGKAWSYSSSVHWPFRWFNLESYPFGVGFVIKMFSIFKSHYTPTIEDEIIGAMAKSHANALDEQIIKEATK